MAVKNYTPSYGNDSCYAVTSIYGNYMGYYVHRTIDEADDDVEITMDMHRYVGRPDLLAYDLYGDQKLWWVFGVRNGWDDPINDLTLGLEMIIPSYTTITAVL